MNEDQPRNGAEPDAVDSHSRWMEPAESPVVQTAVRVEEEGGAAEMPLDHSAEEEAATSSEPPRRSVVTINRSLFLAMVTLGSLAILALGAATIWLALDRNGGGDDPVVATVNGEQIRRSEYDRAVAQNSGEAVLDNLVVERLIANEAKKRNIMVDEGEASRLLEEQRQQFGNEAAFQSALSQAGLTEADFVRQLRLGVMLRQMVADQTQVSEQEVNDMFQANADRYAGMPEADAKEQIRTGIQRQRENAAARDLLDKLRAEAQIETRLPGKS
jgi:foldase protein PrsA